MVIVTIPINLFPVDGDFLRKLRPLGADFFKIKASAARYQNRRISVNAHPNREKLTTLIDFVAKARTPITTDNFRDWLATLAYENDRTAACPNGDDHPCNNGLGRWLGISAWNDYGFSAARLNYYANQLWKAAVIAAPFNTQKQMYIDLLTELRDSGEYVYDYTAYDYGQADVGELTAPAA